MLSWFAFLTADHPLGITSAFENTAALVAGAVPGYEAANPLYADKAREGKSPKIDWEWMLVLGVFIGAWLSARLSRDRAPDEKVPPLWRWRFGDSVALRYAGAFLGGLVMMLGARIAQGCTSGHAISGVLQLALSSWLFAPLIFAVAIATAFLIYGKEGRSHV